MEDYFDNILTQNDGVYNNDIIDRMKRKMPTSCINSFLEKLHILILIFSKKYAFGSKSNKSLERNNTNYNNKQKIYFEEFLNEGNISQASMLYLTKKIQLKDTKSDILKKFDKQYRSIIKDYDISYSKQDINDFKSFLHVIIKDKGEILSNFNKVEIYNPPTHDLAENIFLLKRVYKTINTLITVVPVNADFTYKQNSIDIKDVWDHPLLKEAIELSTYDYIEITDITYNEIPIN